MVASCYVRRFTSCGKRRAGPVTEVAPQIVRALRECGCRICNTNASDEAARENYLFHCFFEANKSGLSVNLNLR